MSDKEIAETIRKSPKPDAYWDKLAHHLFNEAGSQISCVECGECCRKIHVTFSEEDSGRMAERLGMGTDAFLDKYFTRIGDGEKDIMKERPCAFQTENVCVYYESRGEDCRGFPWLDQPGFRDRLTALLYELEICPIIKYVWEGIKKKLACSDILPARSE